MKQINILDATATQLAEFANKNLGIEVRHTMGKAHIMAAMQTTGYDKTYILVDDDEPTVDPNARVAAPEPVAERKMVTIRIPSQPNTPGGKEPVPVGVNGKVYLIQRNMDVPVPIEVLKVLENAKQTEYDQGPNGEPINPREVSAFPFSVMGHA